jgi:RNA polymerase sigma-70 factor (ECF subfamily)
MNTPPTEAEDRQDLARLCAGQDSALAALMQRHGERLFHYFIRLLQDEAEAADLTQETFARVYLHRARYQPRHKFSTWLYTIATNLARDRQRWLARHPQISIHACRGGERDWADRLPAFGNTPAEHVEAQERADAVRRALAELPEDLRVPLVLVEYEEQSHAEIAAVMDCSVKAVEMRIYRARQFLRDRLVFLLAEK